MHTGGIRTPSCHCCNTAVEFPPLSLPKLLELQVPSSLFTVQDGCALLGLDNTELVWERSLDSKALVGWRAGADPLIVVGFKGTSSSQNVLTDLKVDFGGCMEGDTVPRLHLMLHESRVLAG